MEHLCERLEAYSESDIYPYHMPGHKRRLCGAMPETVIQRDITEVEGFDNLHQPEGILKELQKKAAQLYGADESFYLTGGSTCGILSAVSAALPSGGHILMARNCHKSAYHAAYLRNLTISYLYPGLLEGCTVCDAVTPGQVREALDREPDIGAVLLVSPTYEGRIADVRHIALLAHERGIPLIVDEAHGAHLGWAEGFARNSCQTGADLVIHSVHKTLPAMTQTALLHVNGSLIDRDRLRRFLHIYQSSSPSYILMASIDNALQIMEERGAELLGAFRWRYGRMLADLGACKHLKFLLPEEGVQDVGKLVILTGDSGLSGQRLYELLLEEYHLQLEMAAGDYCLAMFTVGDGDEAYERMTEALLEIEERLEKGSLQPDLPEIPDSAGVSSAMETAEHPSGAGQEDAAAPQHAIAPGTAWDMPWEWVPLQAATGRHVGDFVNLYPPGVPLLVPGEVLNGEMRDRIAAYLNRGLNLQGVESRDGVRMIKVLKREL